MKRYVGLTDYGLRCGEDHQQAKLSNREIDIIRELHEDLGFSYGYILDWFPVSKSTVAMVCRYERRACTPVRWKAVEVSA